uniref:NADP-dependent oxidoreductase domain-containing protein n=1 Tax=Timema douglasi TaxID=61478 RepID=A0A7R8ZBW3_TIMDO|nr:unnamed protein product [Timema douglasi]
MEYFFKYDIKNIEKAVDAALEAGYRHIDTAYVYDNEAEIGQALVKWLESGKIKREELFITTKLPHYALRPECVEKYLKMSLANLQLDYVDLFLVHHSVGCMEISKEMTDPFVLDPETDHVKIWKPVPLAVHLSLVHSEEGEGGALPTRPEASLELRFSPPLSMVQSNVNFVAECISGLL